MQDKSQFEKSSIIFERQLLKKLDAWLQWQNKERSLNFDRSHIINAILENFLDKNYNDSIDNADIFEIE